jgi:uncharacterized protein (DUF362 family)
MKRREFIQRTAQAAMMLSLATDATVISSGCGQGKSRRGRSAKPDFEVAADARLPKVVLAKNVDHGRAVRMAMEASGGIGRFVKKGERVLLKPNIAWNRSPEQGVNTSPVVVGEMVRLCFKAGAAEVLVTDVGGDNPTRDFVRSGIRQAVEQSGGRMRIMTDDDFVAADLGGRFIADWPVFREIFEFDRLINMPIAKHHGEAFGSAGMKNFYGIVGGNRSRLHRQIDQSIVDLAAYFRPTLTVIDATRVLVRNGPGGGSLDDVVIHNSVICATDQVAGDARAAEFLGLNVKMIPYIALASEQGLGEANYHNAGYKEIGG